MKPPFHLCIRAQLFLDKTAVPDGRAGSYDRCTIHIVCVPDVDAMRRACAYAAHVCPNPSRLEFSGQDDDLITDDMVLLCARRARYLIVTAPKLTDTCMAQLTHCRALCLNRCYGVTRASLDLLMPRLVYVMDYGTNYIRNPATCAWLNQLKKQGMLEGGICGLTGVYTWCVCL